MPHPLIDLPVRTVVRHAPVSDGDPAEHAVATDVCVVGSGIAGLSAAAESARLGRRVVLVDAAPEPAELAGRVAATAREYGLRRRDGLASYFPGRAGPDGSVHDLDAAELTGRVPENVDD
ncbi:FAD-dependent oxidoreductase [Pseudonocardia sp. NPDC049635]|uniref:FAD-dependent oxidoreductase n=1 Tax=Pseudonocardia sp. NPDC049635 TaxID=3155506 RepID=UPI0033DA542B